MEEPLDLPPILIKILFIVFCTLNYQKCSEQNKFMSENQKSSKDFILRLDKLDAYFYQKSLIVLLKVFHKRKLQVFNLLDHQIYFYFSANIAKISAYTIYSLFLKFMQNEWDVYDSPNLIISQATGRIACDGKLLSFPLPLLGKTMTCGLL